MSNVRAYVPGKFQSRRKPGPSPSELAAINEYAVSKGLSDIRILGERNVWSYWLRGKLFLSNLATIYAVAAKAPDGVLQHIHVAFDPWDGSNRNKLQVLSEKRAP